MEHSMNKLAVVTIISLPLAASVPALAQEGAAPQPTQSGASQSNAVINLSRDQVERLQQALNDNGFDAGEVDGVFGPQTGAALSRFQSKAGLQPTGRIDEQTLAAVGLSGQVPKPPSSQGQTTGQGGGPQPANPGPQGPSSQSPN
jgi:peptidoglycan hydrolase-like protein with peptidoglycan-binding domain